jgi:polysaccharide biosynthesis/export protein
MKRFILKMNSIKRLATQLAMPLLGTLLAVSGCSTSNPSPNHFAAPPPASKYSKGLNNAPAPAKTEPIILRDGDVLHVSFPSSPSLDTTQQIRRDGKIVLPLVGEVEAAGKSPEDLQKDLIKLYQPQVATKQVIVTVQSSTYPIFVTGAVLRPGKIEADRPMTVLEAVMEAGGFDYTKANLKAVSIIRQDKNGTKKFTVNLKKMMKGSEGTPFYLKPSDIIFVPDRFTWY